MCESKPIVNDTLSLLELNNITVVKGDKRILDSISLDIKMDENVAIVGPNGSGKSSLIKTITKEYRPLLSEDGMVFKVMGKDKWKLFELRNILGIVSGDLQQEYTRAVSGLEAVISGFFGSIGIYENHIVTFEMEERARQLLDFLEIPYLGDKDISQMSTGEARRILIARALVNDPLALVLDEPTNSLDLKSLHIFRESIRKVASSGKNIILVTHHLEEIIPEINRVILVKDGRIFRDGPKEDILNRDNLSELFGLPVDVMEGEGYYRAWC